MLTVIVDSREQAPYHFDKYEGVTIRKAALETGDYSLPGLEHIVCVERKSVDDLIQCLCRERSRFERELSRMRAYVLKAVVCECTLEDIARGRFRSAMNPQSALQSVFAFQVRYAVPFVWAGNRGGGEYATHALLHRYAQELQVQVDAIRKHSHCAEDHQGAVGSCKVVI
jgi:DNA excision repair protein ERCC-4